jgi:hypothetical protein
MVLLFSALPHAINTMKNTIDDSDYIIDSSYLIAIFQWVTNTRYSHSIVNKPFFRFTIYGLFVGACGNTMKYTMLRIC